MASLNEFRAGGLALAAAAWLAAAPAAALDPPAGAAAATAGATPSERATGPRPAIWLLADDDTRIYLFGTVHILPPNLEWRTAALDRIVAEADELVMETAEDPREEDPAELMQHLMLGKEAPILWRVSPGRRKGLREIIETVGMPVETFDGMQTWAAAMTIAVTGLAQAYAGAEGDPEALTGVEDALRDDFVEAGRPISGVETGPQQMGFLAGMSFRSQREMLESMVDAYRRGDADIGEPDEDSWLSGDVDRLGAEMAEMPPEMFDILITRRNRAWTGWLIDRLDRPGTVLFAVGAGHLAGRDSVQSMLAARGFTVTRLH